ncbi:hypothetical protein FQA39_LY01783 [Lamprigera yunnana]|nr:hypothetical protein FQA39_LY01783 [Lamprigera yunnana]
MTILYFSNKMKRDEKTLKRKERQKRKFQKMNALLEIATLNEEDRKRKANTTELAPKRPCLEERAELASSDNSKVESYDYLKLKRLIKDKCKTKPVLPKFYLREIGEAASLEFDKNDRVPLFLADIQHLLLYSQLGHHSSYAPTRWCQLKKYNHLKRVNVLIVENVALQHFESCEDSFNYLNSNFSFKLEVISAENYRGDTVHDLMCVPLTGQQTKVFTSEYGSLENAVFKSTTVFDMTDSTFPIEASKASVNNLPTTDKFSRTELLLSGWQMIQENYPMPIKGLMEKKFYGYALTKDLYKDVTPFSPLFGVDCEMCLTNVDSELTRLSVVNERGESIYDEIVKPANPIIDYITRFSGITPKMMKNATKTLQDVQEDLRRLLPPDAILVGQSLANDLHALKMMHPYVIDTSVIYNLTGDPWRKTKLQTLANEFLHEKIQNNRSGHCSVEDSSAAMKLVQLKLKHDLSFGDASFTNISMQVGCYVALGNPNFATSFLKQITRMEKTAQIISSEGILNKYRHCTLKKDEAESKAVKFISSKNNEAVIKKFKDNCDKHSFNIAHVVVSAEELTNDAKNVCKLIDKWVEEVYTKTEVFEMLNYMEVKIA